MKSVITPLAKSVLIPLGITAAASAADAYEIEDLIKIVKSLEDSALLLKGITESV